MKRLAVALILPTAGLTAAYLSGLAWPILGAGYALFGRRIMSPETEPDPIG